ncbi:hypothetical protein KU306_04360 [Haloferax larsenii]|uniref:Intracellular proteinase inhibitor n=1 Tax=Haloferax larsenii TaxID=302484 RepID=A0ABY5RFJ2_HALLR|nr:hypothetical protein [Haloferax larsenii]UVE51121.1 hypothetical protein KU306_04360 [Haloferax larsenii]
MDRRTLLQSASTLVIGGCLAGCTRFPPRSTAAAECAPGYQATDIDVPTDLPAATDAGVTLTLTPQTVAPTEAVTATLRNGTQTAIDVSATPRFTIQGLNSNDEWTHALGVATDHTWTETTNSLAPGAVDQWSFKPQRGGFPEPYERCQAFVPGTYRVVYYGWAASRPLLAAEFTVTES